MVRRAVQPFIEGASLFLQDFSVHAALLQLQSAFSVHPFGNKSDKEIAIQKSYERLHKKSDN